MAVIRRERYGELRRIEVSMKLAASNLAWSPQQDSAVLRYMADHGFTGLEVAPTKIVQNRPYDYPEVAREYSERIKSEYGLQICSMQSLWYGIPQRIAESAETQAMLLEYTKRAIRFADAIECRNIVFGCPRNRVIKNDGEKHIVEEFLLKCAEESAKYGIVIAVEANPPIYQTNYLNNTYQVLDLIKRQNHPSLKLNLDCGTVIENGEKLNLIFEDTDLISHVHISEPELVIIKKREIHRAIVEHLRGQYHHFISIEMQQQKNIDDLFSTMKYIRDIFE